MEPPRPPSVLAAVGDRAWQPVATTAPVAAPAPTPGPGADRPADPLDGVALLRWPGAAWEVAGAEVRWSDDPVAVTDLAERHRWLSEHSELIAAPRLVERAEDEPGGAWVVTPTTGETALRPERQPRPDDVPAAIGAALRSFHELDPAIPFESGWQHHVDRLAAAVAAGSVDPSRLPSPYDRYDPARLVELIVETRPPGDHPTGGSGSADRVVVHGAATVANVRLDGGAVTALTGAHRAGLGDRHLDLACAHRSIVEAFGPDALPGFYEGYGDTPDMVHLDHYVLVDVVTEAVLGGRRR